MADPGDDHIYDGIKELDNDLPRWWRWMFAISIGWAVLYPLYYHDDQRLGAERLAIEQTAAAEERAKHEVGPLSEDTLRAMSHNPERIAHGGLLFQKSGCMVCHGPEGTGQVGPNLRDDYWIYGNDLGVIVDVIANGRGPMPPQKLLLGGDEIRDLACWIAEQSRSGRKPGKEPDPAREKLAPIRY